MKFFNLSKNLWLWPAFFWSLALCSFAQAASSQYDSGSSLVSEEFYQIVVSVESLWYLGLSEEDLEAIIGNEMLSQSRKLEEVLTLLQEAYEASGFDGTLLVQACPAGEAPKTSCTTIDIKGSGRIPTPGGGIEGDGKIRIERCITTCVPRKQPSSNGSKETKGDNGGKKGDSYRDERIVIFFPLEEI